MPEPNASMLPAVLGALVLAGGLFPAPARADQLTLPLALPGGGRVVKKQDTQQLTERCGAQRTWVEIEGASAPEAAERINEQIRKRITVGRKLTPADCAGSEEEEEEEDFNFVNVVGVTGVWPRFLGTSTLVCFPGGSGRCTTSCEVYDLHTGKRDNLRKYVNPAGRAKLEQLVSRQAEVDGFPGGYLPLPLKSSTMCLASDGITIYNLNDSGHFSTEFKVPLAQLPRYFRLPPALASDAPKRK